MAHFALLRSVQERFLTWGCGRGLPHFLLFP
jgi:hypothetical protein